LTVNCSSTMVHPMATTCQLFRRLSRRWYAAGLPESLRLPALSELDDDCKTSFATVSVVGHANAGKSTLTNRIVGGRVSAVSRKVNTTRRKIVGLYTASETQLAFTDTPGVVERHLVKDLGSERRQLATDAWGAAAESDLAVLLVDASRSERHWEQASALASQLCNVRKAAGVGETREASTVIFALNKADKVKPKSKLLSMADYFVTNVPNFAESFYGRRPLMISAATGRGVDDVIDALLTMARPGKFLVPEREARDSPAFFEDARDVVLEHIWEKLLHCVHEELPYACRIALDEWKDLQTGDISCSVVIRYVAFRRHAAAV
jgi:GTPase